MTRKEFERAFAQVPASLQREILASMAKRLTDADAQIIEEEEQKRVDSIAVELLQDLDL